MTNLVSKRLTARLMRDDRADIQTALLNYVIDHELDPASLSPNQ